MVTLMGTIDRFLDALSKYINHICIKIMLFTKLGGQPERLVTGMRINIYFPSIF